MNARVVSCQVNGDGSLGPWIENEPMPQPLYSSSACGLNDYLVTVAGRYREAYPTNVIWHTRVVDGRLQPWQMLKTDLDTRVYHALGLDKTRGYVFIVGGRNKSVPGQAGDGHYVDRVQAFRLSQPQTSELNTSVIAAEGTTSEIRPGDLRSTIANASRHGKKILAYFYSPEVPACRRFWDLVLQSSQFKTQARQFEIVAVDVTTPEGGENAKVYSIFRVPTLSRFSSGGLLEKTTAAPQAWADVEQMLR